MSINIICPSGFAGTARKLKGREVQAMADELEGDQDIADAGWGSILTGPWQQITEAGPYSFLSVGEFKPDWSRMLKGDVIGVLLQLRIGSFRDGEVYDFDFQCQSCKHLVPWTINLIDDVLPTVQELGARGRAHLLDHAPLVAELADGTEVEFTLGTFAGDRDMNKLRKQLIRRGERKSPELLLQDTIASQTVRVGGQALDIRRRYQWASDLDMDDLLDLQEQFELADCGYDTTIEVRCTRCSARMEMNLPLGGDFLVPRRQRRKRRQQRAELRSEGQPSSADGDASASTETSSTDNPAPCTS